RAEDPYPHRHLPPGCQRAVSTQTPLSSYAARKTSEIHAPGAPEFSRRLRFRRWTQQSRKAQRIQRGTTMKSEIAAKSALAVGPGTVGARTRGGVRAGGAPHPREIGAAAGVAPPPVWAVRRRRERRRPAHLAALRGTHRPAHRCGQAELLAGHHLPP